MNPSHSQNKEREQYFRRGFGVVVPGPGFDPWSENENPVSHAAQPKKLEIKKVRIKEALPQSSFGWLSKSLFPEQREHSVAGPGFNISPHQVLEAAYVGSGFSSCHLHIFLGAHYSKDRHKDSRLDSSPTVLWKMF